MKYPQKTQRGGYKSVILKPIGRPEALQCEQELTNTCYKLQVIGIKIDKTLGTSPEYYIDNFLLTLLLLTYVNEVGNLIELYVGMEATDA